MSRPTYYAADMEMQHYTDNMSTDPAIRRRESMSILEQELSETEDTKWVVKDLRRLISSLRDLDFQDDSREKIPEKWSVRPEYLPVYVSFFDPQNGPKMENNKRGRKPNKSSLLPLFRQMRNHHFPNLCSTKKETMYMNECGVRRRGDATNNAKAGVFNNIDIPTLLQGESNGCYKPDISSDFKTSKPTADNFIMEEKPGPMIPVMVEEQEPVDVALNLDQEKINNIDEKILIEYITKEDLLPTIPSENLDVAMEEEVWSTDAQGIVQNTTSDDEYAASLNSQSMWSDASYQQLTAIDIPNGSIKTETPSPSALLELDDSCPDEFRMTIDANLLTNMDFELVPANDDDLYQYLGYNTNEA